MNNNQYSTREGNNPFQQYPHLVKGLTRIKRRATALGQKTKKQGKGKNQGSGKGRAWSKGKNVKFCKICQTTHSSQSKRQCHKNCGIPDDVTVVIQTFPTDFNTKGKRSGKLNKLDKDQVLQPKTTRNNTNPLRGIPQECPICLTHKGHTIKLGCQHQICKDCYHNVLSSDLNDKCRMCRTDMFSENWEHYLLINASMPHLQDLDSFSYNHWNMSNRWDLDIPNSFRATRQYSLLKIT